MRPQHFVAASLLSIGTYASPLSQVKSKLVVKRQGPGSYYAITGPTGGVQPRLEIRDLEKTGNMWNLYLLAMTEFQAMDQSLIDSWYQIAGIHGMPWIEWDGVSGSTEDRDVGQMGYCPHNMLLFGTWHRPYLTLFEQKLQQIAISIAGRFPTSTRLAYQTAASQLRIPFWDWAKALPTSQPVVPTALSVEKVDVTFPNGTAASIDNPLYDYNFHPLDNSQINGTGCPPNSGTGGLPVVCDTKTSTIRASQDFNDNATLDSRLRAILTSQRSTLYKILSQWQNFDQFSNNGNCGGTQGRIGSLEGLHGPIHTRNFPGHMSPTAVTAFDPMFWFHHANVDRQLALYQAVFPETYMGTCAADTPTFTIDRGESLDASSGLTPFHKNAAGDFWSSTDARSIQNMGYTYPELVRNPPNATLVASIKAQYSGPADVPVTAPKSAKRDDKNATTTELYLAQVNLPLYGLDNGVGGASAYDVLVFVGDVSGSPKNWTHSDNFYGIASTIGGGIQSDQIAITTVDLSEALQKGIDSGATTKGEAVDYLKKNLRYRLQIGNVKIPREKVKDLKVSLISTKVEVAQSDDVFDRWVGGFKEHGEVDG
ncbi:common central domain of tyrosinase-domain-containing protein [Lophiotrema nucula]|uniref:tyrosinase n=1 Tax=Lophiotrema nucula TaxID=690887 RepID=A0A6A5ZWD5_9PLEO|nr:common central domain of tyrosinase-domain-containing protein [Lophiotrema nucula]